MATSSIRYGTNDVFVEDQELGDWIKAVIDQFELLISEGKDIEWLLVECNRWSEIFENYPPGLKDVEFDDILEKDTNIRKNEIIGILNLIISAKSSKNFNLSISKKISVKILSKLFGLHVTTIV